MSIFVRVRCGVCECVVIAHVRVCVRVWTCFCRLSLHALELVSAPELVRLAVDKLRIGVCAATIAAHLKGTSGVSECVCV